MWDVAKDIPPCFGANMDGVTYGIILLTSENVANPVLGVGYVGKHTYSEILKKPINRAQK